MASGEKSESGDETGSTIGTGNMVAGKEPVVMTVMLPNGSKDESLSPSTLSQQIVWVPKMDTQPPALFSIKQLNYSQVLCRFFIIIFCVLFYRKN